MKLKAKELKKLRDFEINYLDKSFRIEWNTIRLNKSDSKEHNKRIAECCIELLHNNIPFMTQAIFKSRYRPDIICPSHVFKIIEVRHTETEKRTHKKLSRIPLELQSEILYINTKEKFKPEMIL